MAGETTEKWDRLRRLLPFQKQDHQERGLYQTEWHIVGGAQAEALLCVYWQGNCLSVWRPGAYFSMHAKESNFFGGCHVEFLKCRKERNKHRFARQEITKMMPLGSRKRPYQ
ncbi:MAG: hypothetical protein RIQ54_539 [Candidatus Parcubacteria bacterium]